VGEFPPKIQDIIHRYAAKVQNPMPGFAGLCAATGILPWGSPTEEDFDVLAEVRCGSIQDDGNYHLQRITVTVVITTGIIITVVVWQRCAESSSIVMKTTICLLVTVIVEYRSVLTEVYLTVYR
jgi:hypothetical protein